MPTYTYCSVPALMDAVTGVWWRPGPDEEALVRVVREASELGRRAYGQATGQATTDDAAVAERLLYVIHRSSAFAPPVAAIPSVIWSILVQAKLDALLPRASAGALDAGEMVAQLERGVQTTGTHDHPLLDDLAKDASLRGYRVFLKNWYAMASGFTELLIAVAQHATAAMRSGVIENLSDEIFDEVPHIDLRARVLEGAGTHFDPLGACDDPDISPETLSLINWRAAASALSNPSLALGLFYAIEANWKFESRRHYAALKALGVRDDYLQSLAIHVDRDEDHAGAWLTMTRDTVTSPGDRAVVVLGLSVEFAVRRRMYDSIRRYLYDR